MARISLLFALALVLAISSVWAHPPTHKKTKKSLCPPTLSGLQTFPAVEISKLIEKKVKSAPATAEFNTLFAICKAYSGHLAAFKVAGVKNVFGLIQAKYTMMTKAMFAAQAIVGVEGKLAFKLGKSYTAMASGFAELEGMIAEISAKYKFNAKAVISKGDKAKIEKCLIKLKGSISVFVKVISECSKKFSIEKKIMPVVAGDGLVRTSFKNGVGLGGHMIGAGGKVGVHAGAKVAGHAGAEGMIDANVGGHAGGNVGALLGGIFGKFGSGRIQYDAAGKAKFGGGSEFRPLSHPRNKHLN